MLNYMIDNDFGSTRFGINQQRLCHRQLLQRFGGARIFKRQYKSFPGERERCLFPVSSLKILQGRREGSHVKIPDMARTIDSSRPLELSYKNRLILLPVSALAANQKKIRRKFASGSFWSAIPKLYEAEEWNRRQ
jgi:hypothetical protein